MSGVGGASTVPMPPPPLTGDPVEGRRIAIRGTVQGVGFRPWVYRLAREMELRGRVRNDASGVVIEAFGAPAVLDAFCRRLEESPPAPASIRELRSEPIRHDSADACTEEGFVIIASDAGDERRLSIPPDLATCDECQLELGDPVDRRHGYAFTNCTHCGPRYTIASEVPYDRPATSMASFELCPECRREYLDPDDRRFHAQPNACPTCGPRLWLVAPDGEEVEAADPVMAAAAALAEGQVVAVKGLGGFHLACDATSEVAVLELRRRKRREEKPFAVMVRDLGEARRLAVLSNDEATLLASAERPVVLLRERSGSGLASAVAPGLRPTRPSAGSWPARGLVGLMLPYTPLHHLLLAAAARPLVMTSGNRSQEPIAFRNEEARERLGDLADLFLLHDREIVAPCDDSVVQWGDGAPMVLRRSRGFVPRPIALAQPLRQPILACGAQLKNTFCIGVGDCAYLGPHVGDLETVEGLEFFEQAVEHVERLLRVEPEVVAYDLHPEYLSSRYGRQRRGVQIEVQHHHAHVASALAEHGLDGPVLGVAYDGVGYGTDGNAWGGELLLADAHEHVRLATLRPLPLAGGDVAVRQVWRLALALLDDAFDGDAPLERFELFRRVPEHSLAVVRQMLRGAELSPPAHGVGRYFDAVGALLTASPEAHHEGQVALRLNLAADPWESRGYPWRLEREVSPWQLDLRPAVRALVADLLRGLPVAEIAARFHNTLAVATAGLVRAAAAVTGELPVVLTGGCFQNVLLARATRVALGTRSPVYQHRQVPPGDGGIALGQLLVADTQTRRSPCA